MVIAMTAPHPDQLVSLPTSRLVAGACLASGTVGVVWALGATLLGAGTPEAVAGLLAGGAVAAGSVVALLSIRPWRERSLARWPLVWMGGSAVRFLGTLALAFLLYSATPYGSIGLWLAVVVAYMATLVTETRLYALHMKRYAPPGVAASE